MRTCERQPARIVQRQRHCGTRRRAKPTSACSVSCNIISVCKFFRSLVFRWMCELLDVCDRGVSTLGLYTNICYICEGTLVQAAIFMFKVHGDVSMPLVVPVPLMVLVVQAASCMTRLLGVEYAGSVPKARPPDGRGGGQEGVSWPPTDEHTPPTCGRRPVAADQGNNSFGPEAGGKGLGLGLGLGLFSGAVSVGGLGKILRGGWCAVLSTGSFGSSPATSCIGCRLGLDLNLPLEANSDSTLDPNLGLDTPSTIRAGGHATTRTGGKESKKSCNKKWRLS